MMNHNQARQAMAPMPKTITCSPTPSAKSVPTRAHSVAQTSSSIFLITRLLAGTIILVAALHFIGDTLLSETHRFKYDFAMWYTVWYAAQHDLPFYDPIKGNLLGDSPYLSHVAQEAGIPRPVPYFVYSPAFALIGRVLPLPSYRTAELMMVWTSGLIWLFTAVGMTRLLPPDNPLARAGVFAVATIFPPALMTLSLGQPNIVITALALLIAWGLIRGYELWPGLLVGLIMLAKPHFGLFLLYFLIKRRWADTIAALVLLLGLCVTSAVVFDFGPWIIYLNNILPAGAGGMAYIANQSVHGVLMRLFINDPNILFTDALLAPNTWPSFLSSLASIILISLALYKIWRSGSKMPTLPEISLILLTLLLATRVATIHHFTWAFFSIIILWRQILIHGTSSNLYRWRIPLLMGTVLLFIPVTLFFTLFLGHPLVARILAWPTFGGALVLWSLNIYSLKQHRIVP